jgi:hypothetical protein
MLLRNFSAEKGMRNEACAIEKVGGCGKFVVRVKFYPANEKLQ